MANPIFDSNWIKDLCALGPRPLAVDGWIRSWLTHHFSSTSYLENQDTNGPVQRMLWNSSPRTGILIESHHKWRPETTETRPAIILKRNGWQKRRIGIGDKMLWTNHEDGNSRYENWWQGSHTIFCITNSGSETELLAAEVFGELNKFAPIARSILDLKKLEVLEVGELAILSEGRNNFVVPIVLSYIYSEAWVINQDAETFRKIDISGFLS